MAATISQLDSVCSGKQQGPRPELRGTWFNDGFAGAMGELLSAIEQDREPLNSAPGNLLSLRLCLAAVRSSRTGETVSL